MTSGGGCNVAHLKIEGDPNAGSGLATVLRERDREVDGPADLRCRSAGRGGVSVCVGGLVGGWGSTEGIFGR